MGDPGLEPGSQLLQQLPSYLAQLRRGRRPWECLAWTTALTPDDVAELVDALELEARRLGHAQMVGQAKTLKHYAAQARQRGVVDTTVVWWLVLQWAAPLWSLSSVSAEDDDV